MSFAEVKNIRAAPTNNQESGHSSSSLFANDAAAAALSMAVAAAAKEEWCNLLWLNFGVPGGHGGGHCNHHSRR